MARTTIAERVLKEINARLGFLLDVGSTTSRCTARRRPRCRAARPSASGSPARSAPASSGCSTCSTSRRSACTSATTTPHRDAASAARPRQHRARRRARRGHHRGGRLGGRHRSRRGRARRAIVHAGTVKRPAQEQGVDHRPVPVGQAIHPRTPSARRPATGTELRSASRARASTTSRGRRRHSRSAIRGGHRRVGVGQVDARQRHPAGR
jgi:hypothetical protein